MLTTQDLNEGAIVHGASLNEPVKIIKVIPLGTSVKIMGQGLKHECQCTLAGVSHRGQAWVLPHPDRQSPGFASMVSNAETERSS